MRSVDATDTADKAPTELAGPGHLAGDKRCIGCGRPLAPGRLTYCNACLQAPAEPERPQRQASVLAAFSGIMVFFGALGFVVCALVLFLDYSFNGPTASHWIALALLGPAFGLLFQGCRARRDRQSPAPQEPAGGEALAVLPLLLDDDVRHFTASVLTSVYFAPLLIIAVVGAVFYLPPTLTILFVKSVWEGIGWILSRSRMVKLTATSGFLVLSLLAVAGWWGPMLLLLGLGLLFLSAAQSPVPVSIESANRTATAGR